MGQSASSHRTRHESLDGDSRRLQQATQGSGAGQIPPPDNVDQQSDSQSGSAFHPVPQEDLPSPPLATFSRQISAQSIPVLRDGSGIRGDISTRDEIFYEQHEARPLVHMEDLGMRDAPITHITASPMPRRSNRLARLSSFMVPRNAAGGVSEEDHNFHVTGWSFRRGLSNSLPSRDRGTERSHRRRRSSLFSSLSPLSHGAPRPRERSVLTSISRPIPLALDAIPHAPGPANTSLRDNATASVSATSTSSRLSRFRSLRDSSRLSRMRQSISAPFESFIPQSQSRPTERSELETPPRPSRSTMANGPDFMIPPLSIAEPNISLDSPVNEALSLVGRGQRLSGISSVTETPGNSLTRSDGPSWTDRWAERGPTTRRESRRMPSMLRGRSSRFIRRDNDGPLPRILHLAATAIAAQLSGSNEQPVPDEHGLGPEDLDGSLQNLFRTLQNASTPGIESRTRDSNNDASRQSDAPPPLNFLRVFRFVSQSSAVERSGRRASNAEQIAIEGGGDDAEGRTVTLVVVGVRSVPAQSGIQEETTLQEPSIDRLLSLSTVPPSTNILRNGASGLFRHANSRARNLQRRRASIGGTTTFPANFDSQRHQRSLSSTSGSGPLDSQFSNTSSAVPMLSDSPPGPHPPPSTPADPGLSAQSSATTTPSRRPSSVSVVQQPPVPSRDAALAHSRGGSLSPPADRAFGVQQRRRSDSEFARHRDLGAGAARRNGVVEPDELDNTDAEASSSRSWLIYVVGTNLAEDHPALTTPSLFTDVSQVQSLLSYLFLGSSIAFHS